MPLPIDDQEWPPRECKDAQRFYDVWGAWYAGDTARLSDLYGGGNTYLGTVGDTKAYDRSRRPAGTIIQRARRYWGSPPAGNETTQHKLHVPLPADIAMTSADLLFGEPPKIQAEKDAATTARIEKMLDEGGAAPVFLEGAEIGAAYGGHYIRVTVDKTLSEFPIWDAIPPDAAVPEWRVGWLSAVTFWRELRSPDSRTWRHLERHEAGRIYHGLYASRDADKLGRPMPLDEHPATQRWASEVDAYGGIDTGADGLAVEYFPNMRPNRKLRGSPLGRSDYSGVEPLFDAVDEGWSSWMRDLRIGKGRIVVPSSYVRSLGRGNGGYFDMEQEVFLTVESLSAPDAGLQMNAVQFQIRVEEHAKTVHELTVQALRGAGYSAQTFGEEDDQAATATEVVARTRRSMSTRARKINYTRPPLGRLWNVALQMDVKFFNADGIKPQVPNIEFPDGVAIDPESNARTVQLIHAAEGASTYIRVQMLHPDWDDKKVREEVARIREESGAGDAIEVSLGQLAGNQPAEEGEAGTAPMDAEAPDGAPNNGAPAPPNNGRPNPPNNGRPATAAGGARRA